MRRFIPLLFILLTLAAAPGGSVFGQTYTYKIDTTFSPQDKGDGSDDALTGKNAVSVRYDRSGKLILGHWGGYSSVMKFRNKPLKRFTRLGAGLRVDNSYNSSVPTSQMLLRRDAWLFEPVHRDFRQAKGRFLYSDRDFGGARYKKPFRMLDSNGVEIPAFGDVELPGVPVYNVDAGFLPTGELYLSYILNNGTDDMEMASVFDTAGNLPVMVSGGISIHTQSSSTANLTIWDRDADQNLRRVSMAYSVLSRPGQQVRLIMHTPSTGFTLDTLVLQSGGTHHQNDYTYYSSGQIFAGRNGKLLIAFYRYSTPNRIATEGPNGIIVRQYKADGGLDSSFSPILLQLPELAFPPDQIIDSYSIKLLPLPGEEAFLLHVKELWHINNQHPPHKIRAMRKYNLDGTLVATANFDFVTKMGLAEPTIGPQGQIAFLNSLSGYAGQFTYSPSENPTPVIDIIQTDARGNLLPVAMLSGGFNGPASSMSVRPGTNKVLAGGGFTQAFGTSTGGVAWLDGLTGRAYTGTHYNGSYPTVVQAMQDGAGFVSGPRGESVAIIDIVMHYTDARRLTRRLNADLTVDWAGPAIDNGLLLTDKSFASFTIEKNGGFHAHYITHYDTNGVRQHGPKLYGDRYGTGFRKYYAMPDTGFLALVGNISSSTLYWDKADLSHTQGDDRYYPGDMVVDRRGGALVRGHTTSSPDMLIRYLPNRQVEASFQPQLLGKPLALLPDSSALVLSDPGVSDSTLHRLLPDGSVDPNFMPIKFSYIRDLFGASVQGATATDDGQYIYLYGEFLGTFGGKPSSRVLRLVKTPLVITRQKAATTGTLFLKPNPARNTVWLDAPGATTARLHALDGRYITEASLTAGKGRLSLEGLPKGLYLVKAGGRIARLAVE